jgi:hypothetical protein
MAKKKNRYQKKANKKNFLTHMNNGLDTKGNVKNTLLETGKDLLVGVIGGGIVGAAIGKPSLGIGILVTGVGHYTNNKLATIFGIGMMAANGFQKGNGVNGLEGLEGLEGVKERLQAYKVNFSEKLFLDKIIKKKTGTVAGLGNVQYFTYPINEMNGGLAALDYIESQIAESGVQQLQMAGNDIGGLDDIQLMDIEDRML